MPAKRRTQPAGHAEDGTGEFDNQQALAPKPKEKACFWRRSCGQYNFRGTNADCAYSVNKATSKYQEKDDHKDIEIEQLHKQLNKYKKRIAIMSTASPRHTEDDFDQLPVESEEEDEPQPLANLHSSPPLARAFNPCSVPLGETSSRESSPLTDHRSDIILENSSLPPSRSLSMTTLKVAPFRSNQPPSGRAKAFDYVDDVKVLLLDAIRIFECYIYTINPFPSAQEQEQWAQNIWAMVTREDGQHYVLSDRMTTIIKARKSNARGDVVDLARPLTQQAYGFVLGSETKGTERKNVRRYQNLTDDSAFHYKTYDAAKGARSGFAQHKHVSDLIQKAFFKNTRALGVEYQKYFDPIPLVTIAFIFTVISANLDEWASGKYVQAQFRESDHKANYQNYLQDLMEWERSAPEVVQNIRKKWHDRARRIAGAVAENAFNGRFL
ncbi:hypothetical protein A0H81_05569 [Grifola frondosa]|uniref:DUF6532 domain-containing protein n=1 Tax=Grifola frondosa TaxID=5627 RepID=A0A1C7MCT6_GRIFR|nr:hypothetical protein A0H81_05569 [Grifola frondosa]